MPDSSPNSHVPSLKNWPGEHDFKISLPTGNKDRNKGIGIEAYLVVSTYPKEYTLDWKCINPVNSNHEDISGTVVGRQVLDLKCCRCPSRDMLNEDKAEEKRQRPAQPNSDLNQLDRVQGLKRSAVPVATTGDKKKRFNIKMEPGTENRYKSVIVLDSPGTAFNKSQRVWEPCGL
ncbi:hypothetical protein E2C01_024772 [Portunus trituberculatus]|uniref:p53 DNA-binding domain-containing protein n=1 Tax=Portunus trituberculatus TaxID=210409 RepID=A0A5B7EBF9_PORTR|nr:hypothetical protein [Portunus trituberculatus]